jgi:hypothetical protein
MQKLVLMSVSLLAAGGIAAPTAAKEAKCEAKYYGHLVGKDISETHTISSGDYRLVPVGSAAVEAKQGRMTIRYDKNSNRIVDVSCG